MASCGKGRIVKEDFAAPIKCEGRNPFFSVRTMLSLLPHPLIYDLFGWNFTPFRKIERDSLQHKCNLQRQLRQMNENKIKINVSISLEWEKTPRTQEERSIPFLVVHRLTANFELQALECLLKRVYLGEKGLWKAYETYSDGVFQHERRGKCYKE